MARPDPHSWHDDTQPRTRSLELKLAVDFERRILTGEATLHLAGASSGPLDLDSRGLVISQARTGGGDAVPFSIAEDDPIIGQRLRLELPAGTSAVTLRYRTAPDASALQWLQPAQTAGGRHPFLFSQCQAIHARSVAPLQDTPVVRIPYRAEITVPEPLSAVMSAAPAGERKGPAPGTRTILFDMPQPIPPYLLALAVGELASRDLSPRSRVWAEPETVERAAWEFAEIETFIRKAEELFGPYDWDRYDMLVLPPSFPYGGMENPRMTFLTPTLLAGDRSLVDVVAHELAHSWTGNLVTNANMDHFWLNEGFTNYAEHRILEALHGSDAAALSWAIGRKSLEESLARFGAGSPLTCLRTQMNGIDPDEAFSSIPYQKGSLFLVALERAAGRKRFDPFLRDYMAAFRFGSLTTEEFLVFLEEKLPGLAARVNARAWCFEPGMPADAPAFTSARLGQLLELAAAWPGSRPDPVQAAAWPTDEMLVYLQNLPRTIDAAGCGWLDAHLKLTGQGNYEILVEWLEIAVASGYEPAFPRLREVLGTVGRMKYLRPLYKAMGTRAETRSLAREIFTGARDRYHGLARRMVESLLEAYPANAHAP